MAKRRAAMALLVLGLLGLGALAWLVLDDAEHAPEPARPAAHDAASEGPGGDRSARAAATATRRRRAHVREAPGTQPAPGAPPAPGEPGAPSGEAPEPQRLASVVDEAGRPVPGALIEIEDDTGRWQGTAGEDGRFPRDGEDPTASERRLRASAPGFVPAEQEVSTEQSWTVVLRGAQRLAGHVTDGSGRRVAEVQVTAVPTGQHAGGRSWTGATGPAGRFELEHLPPGEFEVTADLPATPTRAPGHAVARAVAGTLDLELRLGRALGVRGRVVDEAGRPFEMPVQVVMRGVEPNGDAGTVWTGSVDEDGTFEVPSVNSAANVLWAWVGDADAGVAMTVLRDVPPGAPSIDVVLEPGRVIRARIVDDQGATPPGGAHWYVISRGAVLNSAIAQKGEIVTHPLPYDGRYDLVVSHPSGWTGQARDIRPGTHDVVVAMHRAREITGTVLLPDGGPVGSGVVVKARSVGLDNRGRAGIEAETETDAEGRFRLTGLVDLPFVVSSWPAADGHAPARAPGTCEPGAEVTLRLARGASVSGRVSRAGGEPARGQRLWLLPKDGLGWSHVLTVGEDGTFAARALPAGPVRVVAERASGSVPLGELTAPAKGVHLELPAE